MKIDPYLIMAIFHALWNGIDELTDETDEMFGKIPANGKIEEDLSIIAAVKEVVKPEYHEALQKSLSEHISDGNK